MDRYENFINECKLKDYAGFITQKHHIIPVSQGGTNDSGNLIKLSIHDHFWAHVYYAETYNKCHSAAQYILHHYIAKKSFTEDEWNEAAKIANNLISVAMKNKKPWNTGKKWPDDIKRKVSNSLKGKHYNKGIIFSEEHRKNLSNSLKGKKASEQTRIKLSQSLKNRKFSDIHKKRISESLKNVPLTEERKQNISKSRIKAYYKCLETGEVNSIKQWRKKGFWLTPNTKLTSKNFNFMEV